MMIITGNFGRTQPVKSAVTPDQPHEPRLDSRGPRMVRSTPLADTRQSRGISGDGWVPGGCWAGWFTDTTLLGAGPVGAGELGHQEDMFPFKYIFELFMFYSYFSLEQLFLNSMVLCR